MPRPKNYREKVEDYNTTEKREKKAPNSKEERRKKADYNARVKEYEQEKLPEGDPKNKVKNRYKQKTRGEDKRGKILTESDEPGPGAEIGVWVDKTYFEPYVAKSKMKKAVIEHYSNPEVSMFTRYKDVLPGMGPTDFGLSSESKKWQYWLESRKFSTNFTSDEKREIEWEIWEKRWHGYKHHALNLMNKLYEEGMDGNINAAKEFLLRVLGAPSQQVYLTHEAGDSLQTLFQKFTAVQAYQRPEIDNDGNEVIELDYDEGAGKYYEHEKEDFSDSQEENKS